MKLTLTIDSAIRDVVRQHPYSTIGEALLDQTGASDEVLAHMETCEACGEVLVELAMTIGVDFAAQGICFAEYNPRERQLMTLGWFAAYLKSDLADESYTMEIIPQSEGEA